MPENDDQALDADADAGALLAFHPVLEAWLDEGGTAEAALARTRKQVRAFRALVKRDDAWANLLLVVQSGRAVDSWLATDWPRGFDELLLCAPLCQLVRFECARCTIGARQKDRSCAHPATVFGRVGELLQRQDRDELLQHLDHVDRMLEPGSNLAWDLDACRPVAR
jgi:hypothetical protein